MKKLVLIVTLFLVGCSSPPKPTPVQFGKRGAQLVNPTLPLIKEYPGVIPSESNGEAWEYSKAFPLPLNLTAPEAYYALAHADEIIIYTDNPYLWQKIRASLIQQGANGCIIQQQVQTAFPNHIYISFIKKAKECSCKLR